MAFHASMNPDLLAESLGARRKNLGDLKKVGEGLEALAGGSEAIASARHLRAFLDPLYRPSDSKQDRPPDPFEEENLGKDDPWKVLGLPPDAPTAEVKSTFRRLAVQFHPDAVRNLGEAQQKSSADAFIKIRSAYREIVRRRREG
jgi:DnaJ-domain-containing protein 1